MSMLRGMDAVRRFRTDLALGRLTVPVEVVRGDKDRIASQEWSTTLRRAANARLTSIEGAAHMVPLTHPAAVVAAVHRVRDISRHPIRSSADDAAGGAGAQPAAQKPPPRAGGAHQTPQAAPHRPEQEETSSECPPSEDGADSHENALPR
jgi:hypothetical protein